MADESRDISGTEQLSIVIRFFNDQNIDTNDYSSVVKDYFLGFLPLQEFDAPALAIKIVEFLNELNIPLQSCIALCFDGLVIFFALMKLRSSKNFFMFLIFIVPVSCLDVMLDFMFY
jgi:hypothetical protein